MITKSELMQYVRERGGRISDRQLTFYVGEGLMPKSVRVGSRAGAYPRVVQQLLWWIVLERRRGLSVEALKELLPLWRSLMGGVKRKAVDLGEVEYVARQYVKSPEANFAVPAVVLFALRCPHCVRRIRFTLKDGSLAMHTLEHPMTLGFALSTMSEPDEDDSAGAEPERIADMRIVLPTIEQPEERSTMVLGVPPGITVPPLDFDGDEDDNLTGASHERGAH